MNTINLTIEFKPLTVLVGGNELEVKELSIPLPFGRKPSNINDITSSGHSTVYVTETREMNPEEFDGFSMNLHKSRDWLKGKGGLLCQGHHVRRRRDACRYRI
ncbi:MAG: hypothetical protein ACOYB2_18835 [Limnohabitans sp.]